MAENKEIKIKAKQAGDTFELLGLQWKILDITEQGYLVRAVTPWKEYEMFDEDSNNWTTSELREHLNSEFYKMLVDAIGKENIIPFKRNLISLDGQTEYGTCEDKVSMINVDEYRKYRRYIPNTDDWDWSITPWSTPCNDFQYGVAVVSPRGNFNNYLCYGSNFGVRPVCIFSSSIFES